MINRRQEETSAITSISELMGIEQERLKSESDEQRRKRAEADRARMLAEHEARLAEQARLDAERREIGEQERRHREELARLEAIQLAEIERIRIEAQHAARMDGAREEQRLALELEQMRQVERGKTRRFSALLAGGVVMVAAGFGGVAIDQRFTALRSDLARVNDRLHEADERAAANERLAIDRKDEADRLRGERDAARAEGRKYRERAEAAESSPGASGLPAGGPRATTSTGTPPGVPRLPRCKKGDPTGGLSAAGSRCIPD